MRAAPALTIAAIAAVAGCSGDVANSQERKANPAATAARPVLVELYQSQGCSSCPPANANLNAIAGRSDIIALSFAVTYWDRLGWKDTFASPAYTERQWDYARAGKRTSVATPQMIVDGRKVINGGNRKVVDAAIATASRAARGPKVALSDGRVSVGKSTAAAPATVWLVRYDPRVHSVPIRAGENGGKTLPHRNIVRSLDSIGQWSGPAANYPLPKASNPAYRSAVFVQQGKGGPIVAAARL